jgi:hypothetical protein
MSGSGAVFNASRIFSRLFHSQVVHTKDYLLSARMRRRLPSSRSSLNCRSTIGAAFFSALRTFAIVASCGEQRRLRAEREEQRPCSPRTHQTLEDAMHSGRTVLPIAEAHEGERYILGSRVPMDNEAFHGPWDCAEFVSWCVYQAYGVLFGVRPANPQTADAYTGYWTEDALSAHATIAVSQALNTPGAILLRRPRSHGSGHAIGHIAISRGDGSTVEARGARFGVMIARDAASRPWDYGVLVPGVEYAAGAGQPYVPQPGQLMVTSPLMRGAAVVTVQRALQQRGYAPGAIDGIFGSATEAAVYNFQAAEGVATDGVVGRETAGLLGLGWPIAPDNGAAVAFALAEGREQVRIEALSLRPPTPEQDGDARPGNAGAPQAEVDDTGILAAADAPSPATSADEIIGFERTEPRPGRFVHFAKLANDSRIYLGSETSFTDDMLRRGLFQPASRLNEIADAGRYDRNTAMGIHGRLAQIIWPTVMAESDGYFARLNSYDRAAFTFGCYQAAAHTPDENLIVLFRTLLALPSAASFFPDLTLVEDAQRIPRVHRKLSNGSVRSLETSRRVTRPNGIVETQIPDFMQYLNADPTHVDDPERTATARLLLWCRQDDARNAQVSHAIATARRKISDTMRRVTAFTGGNWREVIWVNDIRHQGRGGFQTIAQAFEGGNVLERLAAIGANKFPERIETVRKCIRTLEAEDVLRGWSAGDLQ